LKLRYDIELENLEKESFEQFNFAGMGSNMNLKSTSYCHVLVTRPGVWIGNWIC
jgi:hypothetical protein